jgi:hypothetical protein
MVWRLNDASGAKKKKIKKEIYGSEPSISSKRSHLAPPCIEVAECTRVKDRNQAPAARCHHQEQEERRETFWYPTFHETRYFAFWSLQTYPSRPCTKEEKEGKYYTFIALNVLKSARSSVIVGGHKVFSHAGPTTLRFSKASGLLIV